MILETANMNNSEGFRRNTLHLAIAVVLATPGVPQVALGQALEEIVVTAQRREESLQDIPVFVTSLQSQDLINRGIQNTENLIGNVAGIGGYSTPGTRGAASLNIRGVAAGSGANLSADPAVGMYFDGVYIGKMMGSSLDVAEIERMEIMRGPQGSLYGRNATAGAVSWVTRKPSGETGLRATATYGNYDEMSLRLHADAPAMGEVGSGLGRLALGAGFHIRKRDGWVKNLGDGPDFDEIDRTSWRIAANWQPSDAVTVDYAFDRSELDEVGSYQKVTGFTPVSADGTSRISALQQTLGGAQFFATMPGADPRIASRWIPSLNATIAAYQDAAARGEGRSGSGVVDFVPINDNWAEGHTLNINWHAGELGRFGDVTFKSISGYRRMETYVYGDLDSIDSTLDANGIGAYNDLVHLTLAQIYGGAVNAGFPPAANPTVDNLWNFIDTLGANHTKQDTLAKYQQFSQELQMIGSTEQLDYLIGALYFSDDGKYRRDAIFAAPLSGAQPQYYDNDTESFAYYAHGAYRVPAVGDRLVLSGGVRYTEERKGIDYNYGANATPFGNQPAQQLSMKDNFYNVSYDGTVTYHFTDSFNAFLRYATSFRSGGFNGEVFGNPYEEETIDQWELGFKSEWLDRRLRLNASVYQYEAEDLQIGVIQVIGGATTSSVVNAGMAKRWGTDVEILAAPMTDLTLGLAYSYIHGDYDRFPPTCTGGTPTTAPICLEANDLARRTSPSNQLSATADYTFARTAAGDFGLYLQFNWQDEFARTVLTTGILGTGDAAVPYLYHSSMLDERTLLSARLGWRNIPVGNGSLQLTLWGQNLLDDDYPTMGINFASLGLVTEQYGNPRMYGIEASYKF